MKSKNEITKSELLEVLKKGAQAWKDWMNENSLDDIWGVDENGNSCVESRIKFNALAELDLSGFVLKEFDLRFFYLRGVNLEGANLEGANLQGANLEGANLYKAIFYKADLFSAYLTGANLREANFVRAILHAAHLAKADLSNADLSIADLTKADLNEANLGGANLSNAKLIMATLISANLAGADLTKADLTLAVLAAANLTKTNFSEANLREANLREANLICSNLRNSNLQNALLIETDLSSVDLTDAVLSGANFTSTIIEKSIFDGCNVYGISVWDLIGEPTSQKNLVITNQQEPNVNPIITVDDIEVAQFIYLMLNNTKIRKILTTITGKGVLILGRFSPERKKILDAIRNKLRELDYVPMMFDFEQVESRDYTETIQILAGMSRFVIADITSPKSSPLELQATVPNFKIPLIPIIQEDEHAFAMFSDLKGKYKWVLEELTYKSEVDLIKAFQKAIIDRAIEKEKELFKEKEKPKFDEDSKDDRPSTSDYF